MPQGTQTTRDDRPNDIRGQSMEDRVHVGVSNDAGNGKRHFLIERSDSNGTELRLYKARGWLPWGQPTPCLATTVWEMQPCFCREPVRNFVNDLLHVDLQNACGIQIQWWTVIFNDQRTGVFEQFIIHNRTFLSAVFLREV
jgi:hypothetical protein